MQNLFNSRRNFLKNSGLAGIPFFLPNRLAQEKYSTTDRQHDINFITDSPIINAEEYISELMSFQAKTKEFQDFYGNGGVVTALEKKFATLTGKQRAVFLPSGTLANNLAIRILSNGKVKVIVQETSHLYRDEAEAAQSIHSKRLIPLAPEKGSFTAEDLDGAVNYYKKGEVFRSDVGVVSIENPVRRMDGEIFPIEQIKKISQYCKANNYKLHLDGARLHIASAYSGVSVEEYSSYFDTVYISLYKYLGSPGGAILCGDDEVISQVPPLIKVFGGSIYQNWPYAALALKNIDTIQQRWNDSMKKGQQLIAMLSDSPEFTFTHLQNGSNMVFMHLQQKVDYQKMTKFLQDKKQLLLRTPGPQDRIRFFINESLLRRPNRQIVEALKEAVYVSKL